MARGSAREGCGGRASSAERVGPIGGPEGWGRRRRVGLGKRLELADKVAEAERIGVEAAVAEVNLEVEDELIPPGPAS